MEIKETIEKPNSVSYMNLCIEIQSDIDLCAKLHGKRDDFDSSIVNFPFMSSNKISFPAYGV